MKISYSVKYSDFPIEVNGNGKDLDKRGITFNATILRYITGLVFLLWIGAVVYFLVFPLLPTAQDIKLTVNKYDPYDLGYTVTTQLFVSLAPPDYEIDGEDDFHVGGPRSIEYVDPGGVELANLELLGTTVVADSANIRGRVVDGYSQEEMLRGFWHFPKSAVPGVKGNTVIFGHRFHKLPPSKETFYHLDDVSVGDKIEILQDDREITYTVMETKVVDKYDESILKQTGDYRLTLITCTPLWTSERRLVVIAIQDRATAVI